LKANNMNEYNKFLIKKSQIGYDYGFKSKWIPDFLFDFQKSLVKWSLQKGRVAIFADCGLGKGQPYGSKVLTPSGWINIENLKINDDVIASDGKAHNVIGVFPKKEIDTYRFFYSDGTNCVFDKDHLHIVRTNNDRQRYKGKKWRVLSTKELLNCGNIRYGKDNKSRNYDIPIVDPVIFNNKYTGIISPYIIGVLLGDGHCSGQVSLSSADKELIKRIKAELPNSVTLIKKKNRKYDWKIKTGFYGAKKSPFRQELDDLGMLGKLSYEKEIPSVYLYNRHPEDRLALLRGLMDTDGYIDQSGCSQFYSTSKKLAENVLFLVSSLGGIPVFRNKKSIFNGIRYRDCYIVVFSLKTFNPFYISRKAKKWNSNPRDNGKWIDKIEFEKKQKTVCISVDSPDKSYITENFVVTHNTPMYLVWAENVVRKTNKPVLIITPLAVSSQTVREGEKFNIDCVRSIDGKIKSKIIVTNYERLHYFDKNKFAGVVCDECFAPDTPIDVFSIDGIIKKKYIKDISRSDKIINAYGVDDVQNTFKRCVDGAVQINISGKKITSSKNHMFFTLHGWKAAKYLQAGDYIMATEAAMRLVRNNFSSEICGTKDAEILRSVLLSEMENEYSGAQSKSSQYKGILKKREIFFDLDKIKSSKSKKTNGKDTQSQSYEQSRDESKSFGYIEEDRTQTFCAWGQWARDDITSAINEGCIVRELDSGICYIIGKKETKFSNLLQSRLGKPGFKNSNRGRRSQPLFEKKTRPKERQDANFIRVDSIEVLESRDSRLDKYRDEKGIVYFYDIKASQHPSYSIGGLLVHNSSAIKHFSSERQKSVTEFMRKMPYRFLCTATAAPNDYIELGTSAEALGQMGRMDMLGTFFKNDENSLHPIWFGARWAFKAHAENMFWRWICSWARALRKPSDIGFDDKKFILPPLIVNETIVKYLKPLNGRFFAARAVTRNDQLAERKNTIEDRCEKVYEKIKNVKNNQSAIMWCHLNNEGDLLEKIIPNSKQVHGRMKDEEKEEILLAFTNGKLQNLIIKPRMGAFGLNWQHCSYMTFFPSHSFEEYYQGIRRCWRFGQKKSVIVDVITTEGELGVLKNLQRKAKAADKMFTQLVNEMNNELKLNRLKEYDNKMEIPKWL